MRAMILLVALAAMPAQAASLWTSYSVTTADGRDTYVGTLFDGTQGQITVRSGTPACKVLLTPCAPTAAQQAATLLAGGLTITSPTLGLSGVTFSATRDASDEPINALLLGELQALQISGGTTFLGGAGVVQWPDTSGGLHQFTPAQFQAFAGALGNFIAGCRNFANGVAGAALPTSAVTLP